MEERKENFSGRVPWNNPRPACVRSLYLFIFLLFAFDFKVRARRSKVLGVWKGEQQSA